MLVLFLSTSPFHRSFDALSAPQRWVTAERMPTSSLRTWSLTFILLHIVFAPHLSNVKVGSEDLKVLPVLPQLLFRVF